MDNFFQGLSRPCGHPACYEVLIAFEQPMKVNSTRSTSDMQKN